MIEPEHDCWWTRRHRSQLSWSGDQWRAAGVPRAVISAVASRLGYTLTEEPDPNDEHGTLLTLGPWCIAMHDGCFAQSESNDTFLREAFIQSVVGLHDYYLGSSIGAAGVALVERHLRDGVTVDLRSDLRRREFQVKSYPVAANWWSRHNAPIERVSTTIGR